MNVFILSTGRSGSTTFARACTHIQNFTSGHESNIGQLGSNRLNYPDNHIESDNRLSWFLGRLEQEYGDRAFYVHLKRDRMETASSYSKRFSEGFIMQAYSRGIYVGLPSNTSDLDICLDYYDTVNSNIEIFLQNKSNKMNFSLQNAHEDFQIFWKSIGAEGDLSASLAEWDTSYNNTVSENRSDFKILIYRKFLKILRIFYKLPKFIKNA